jgi:hypothetical protein
LIISGFKPQQNSFESNTNELIIEENSIKEINKDSVPLNTKKLSITIQSILKAAKIPQWRFAREVLEINRHMLKRLLVLPKPWSMCTNDQKILFKKMKKWAQTPEESITVLKKKLENKDNAVEMRDSSIASIDTLKLASTIKILIKNAGISQEIFATEFLSRVLLNQY